MSVIFLVLDIPSVFGSFAKILTQVSERCLIGAASVCFICCSDASDFCLIKFYSMMAESNVIFLGD